MYKKTCEISLILVCARQSNLVAFDSIIHRTARNSHTLFGISNANKNSSKIVLTYGK